MKRLLLAIATVAAMSACSDSRDRGQSADDAAGSTRDLRIARPDTAASRDSVNLSARGNEPVSPVEQQGPRPTPTPAPRKSARHRTQAAAAPKPPADTATVQGYAPTTDSTQPGAPGTGSGTAPATDTTAAEPRRDSTIAAGDTVSAAIPDSSEMVPVPSANQSATEAGRRTLPIGTEIHAALDDSISSRRDSAGRNITAEVTENVTGAGGRILIRAGSTVHLTVTRLGSSKSKNSQGQLGLEVKGIQLGGELHTVEANVQPVSRELRGRGVTGSEAAKVGVGAAGGAVLGRVIGGNTKGAVIGGVVGAAGGAVVASQTATRDVVVKAKTPLVLVLTAPLITP